MADKKTTLIFDEDLHLKIKIYCAKNKISIKDFVTNAIKEKIE